MRELIDDTPLQAFVDVAEKLRRAGKRTRPWPFDDTRETLALMRQLAREQNWPPDFVRAMERGLTERRRASFEQPDEPSVVREHRKLLAEVNKAFAPARRYKAELARVQAEMQARRRMQTFVELFDIPEETPVTVINELFWDFWSVVRERFQSR